MPIQPETREALTARERAELDWEKESARLQIEYAEKMKAMEFEIKKVEARWTQVFRIPLEIIKLPVRMILAVAIPISVITKTTLPKEFWEFMK
jgi:hypothetical protein